MQEEYMKDAYVLRSMRSDYALFTGQLAILGDKRDFFEKYLRGEINIIGICNTVRNCI